MTAKPLYRTFSLLLLQLHTFSSSRDLENHRRTTHDLEQLTAKFMPRDGGFNRGTRIDLMESTHERIVFRASYEHQVNGGATTHWTHHGIFVRPSLAFDFDLFISGPSLARQGDLKKRIESRFHKCLELPVWQDDEGIFHPISECGK